MREPLEGGCLCGDVRYRLTKEPLTYYVCHCRDCQRQTGSAFGLSMAVPRDGLELLRGEPQRFAFEMPDGRKKIGRYCPRCASRLWGEPEKFPQLLTLRPGTLDDPDAFAPVGHIWTASAQRWVPVPADGPNHERQPGDPVEMVKAWQERAGA